MFCKILITVVPVLVAAIIKPLPSTDDVVSTVKSVASAAATLDPLRYVVYNTGFDDGVCQQQDKVWDLGVRLELAGGCVNLPWDPLRLAWATPEDNLLIHIFESPDCDKMSNSMRTYPERNGCTWFSTQPDGVKPPIKSFRIEVAT